MAQTESTAPTPSTLMRKLGRLGRFVLFLCTAGWAFPHVCTEDMDLTRMQDEHTDRKI